MDNKRKNLEDLEVSINALQKKATLINESIKKNNQFLNKKLIEKENINTFKKDNIPILNKESNISNATTIEELENQLKKELAELKRTQKIFSILFYVIILLFISSIIFVLELNLIY